VIADAEKADMKRTMILLGFASCATIAHAGGFNGADFLFSVPTLDEFGLAALVALVAGVAGWAVRRRAKRR
jgi:ABC-type antimicrobial peptide transport system permease subunit